jgi:hypothetical protein
LSYLRDPETSASEGTRRLHALCRSIIIRRPNHVISLPRRQNRIKTVKFSPEEEREYRKLEAAASTALETPNMSELGASTIWNKLQLIGKLRMFCNLGRASCLPGSTGTELSLRIRAHGSEGPREAMISSQIALGGACCVQCQGIIAASDTRMGHSQSPLAYYSTCGLVFCNSCAGLCSYETASLCKCDSRGSTGRCGLRALCLEYTRGADVPIRPTLQAPDSQSYTGSSSKVRALVKEVMAGLPGKRYALVIYPPTTPSHTPLQYLTIGSQLQQRCLLFLERTPDCSCESPSSQKNTLCPL